MTREQVLEDIKTIPNKNILLTFPTGFGKSRNAIERVKHLSRNNNTNHQILLKALLLILF